MDRCKLTPKRQRQDGESEKQARPTLLAAPADQVEAAVAEATRGSIQHWPQLKTATTPNDAGSGRLLPEGSWCEGLGAATTVPPQHFRALCLHQQIQEPASYQYVNNNNNNNCSSSNGDNGQNESLSPAPQKRKKWTPQPAEDRSAPFLPVRDYYHFESFIKFKDSEWENDVDSDDEVDNSWRHRLEASKLYEYADIPKNNKELMLKWNAFIRSDVVIEAKSIPQKCLDFIEGHTTEIRDAGLGEDLSWHLVNLWQLGLLSSDHVSFCLDHYNKLASGATILQTEGKEHKCGPV